MTQLRRILMVEESPHDAELSLAALAENNVANEVVVVSDGEQALDYMYRRGVYHLREPGNPAVVPLDLKLPRVDGLEVLPDDLLVFSRMGRAELKRAPVALTQLGGALDATGARFLRVIGESAHKAGQLAVCAVPSARRRECPPQLSTRAQREAEQGVSQGAATRTG